jgi:hypothetical protein
MSPGSSTFNQNRTLTAIRDVSASAAPEERHVNRKTRPLNVKSLFRNFTPSQKRLIFTFFQLRSTGYAPSKTQKLTKNQPVFANGRES